MPEADITLYGLNKALTGVNGVILRRGTHLDFFPLPYYPAAPFPSGLAWTDCDGDGEQELEVSLCIGTGTGAAAYQLYLFPWRHDRFHTPVELSEADLAAQVAEAVHSTYDPEAFTFSVQTAGRTWTLGLDADAGWLADAPVGPLTASWRFSYDLEPLEVSIDLMPEGLPLYTPVCYRVPILFDGTRITLDTQHGALTANPGAVLRP